MTSPTDLDLDRLRINHNLDFSDNRSLEEFRTALDNTTSKPGSTATTNQQEAMRKSLVDSADRFFKISTVQTQVVLNLTKDINEEDEPSEINEILIPPELNTENIFELQNKKDDRIVNILEPKLSESRTVKELKNIETQREFLEDKNKLIPKRKLTQLKSEASFRDSLISNPDFFVRSIDNPTPSKIKRKFFLSDAELKEFLNKNPGIIEKYSKEELIE